MKKNTISALAAAGLLAASFGVTGASAADLGGDCCADLEERVAELEATTARKGNRKVSLTISGFVAQQIVAWDDGFEDNVYITDTGSVSIGTHFAFSGKAKISSDVSAGFMIKLEVINNDSLLVSQNADDGILNPGGNAQALLTGSTGPIGLESAYWYLKSKTAGRVSVGQQSSAADNQAILPDGSGSLVQANYVFYDVNAFFTRSNNTYNGFVWGHLANCNTLNAYGGAAGDCDGVPSNVVRYDTPTFAGFSASASWGEDDVWAVSGRYAGEFGGIKIAGAVAYHESSDETGTGIANPQAAANGGLDVGHFQVGGYAEHVATGLFVYGAYTKEDHGVTAALRGRGRTSPEGETWYAKAGIKGKWTTLGGTTLYGEYGQKNDAMAAFLYDAGVNDTLVDHYGVGIVQNIDAAAMQMWLSWRHYEGDVSCANQGGAATCAGVGLNAGNNNLEEFDLVKFGALIPF
ncbi:MAG: porin [Alphaproteobacteria bacterium]|nr:porin [Alphaproteobacteria bacterium]